MPEDTAFAINRQHHLNQVISYYDQCWLSRLQHGHNPQSHAMHMGYYETPELSGDEAKTAMNAYLASHLELDSFGKQVVVDAGCGIGGTVFYLAETFKNARIIGLNISQEQLALAETIRSRRGLHSGAVTFLQEDYSEMSLTESSVDAIFALESLCHAVNPSAFYTEALRVLVPGGRLVILDYARSASDKTAEMLVQRFASGWALNDYLIFSEEEIARCGFAGISGTSILDRVMPGIAASAKNGRLQLGGLQRTDMQPRTAMDKHWEACIALEKLAQSGAVDYRLIKAYKPV